MSKYSVLALLISSSLSQAVFAGERNIAVASLASLELANGEKLAMSRYAALVSPREEQVQLSFNGVNEVFINAELSIDTVRFTDDETLASFLKDAGVKSSEISRILATNRENGFIHSSLCQGMRSDCVIASESIDMAIDYYSKKVRVFLSPTMLSPSSGEERYLTLNGGVGLVNSISAYYDNGINGRNDSYYLRDQGQAGFQSGYINYNIYKSDNSSQIDDLYFTHALLRKNKIAIGRIYSASNFNASSAQSLFANNKISAVMVGSASEYVDRSYGNQTFRYYSPSNGNIEIRRNGEVIYQSSTDIGYHDLNLDALPSGNYTADLIIRSASGAIISRQSILVNNTSSGINEVSYHILMGKGDESYGYIPAENKTILSGGIQFPIFNNVAWFLGAGVVDNLNIFSTGISYAGEFLSLSTKIGSGSNDFKYYEGNLYMGSLSLSYTQQQSGDKWNREKVGIRKDTSFTANYNMALTNSLSFNGGYLYSSNTSPFMLTGINQNTHDTINNDEWQYSSYRTRSLYSNMFYTMNNGVSLYFGGGKDLTRNAYNLSFGFTIPLFNNNVNLSSSTYYTDDRGVSSVTSSASAEYSNKLSDNWSQKFTASTNFTQDSYSSIGYMLSHTSRYINGSGYYYQSDNHQRRFTLNGNSTQVLTSNGLYFSPSSYGQNSSFIILDKNVNYDVAIKDMTNNTTQYLDGKNDIIYITPYHKSLVTMSTDTGNYILSDGKAKKTKIVAMVPGSIFTVNEKALRVNNIIISVKNDKGEFLNDVTCADSSCFSTNRLSNGVYRIKFSTNRTSIRIGNNICPVEFISGKKFYDISCR
ncbi:TcfC E-set like domain-containing protein [Edwardsiella tarda]